MKKTESKNNKVTISQKVAEAYEKMSESDRNKLLKKYNIETVLLSIYYIIALPVVVTILLQMELENTGLENIYTIITFFIAFILTLLFIKYRHLFTKASKKSKVKNIIKQYKLFSEDPLKSYKYRYYTEDKGTRALIYVGIGSMLLFAVVGIYVVFTNIEIGAKIIFSIFSVILILSSIVLWIKCLKKPK
ncbi:MAG: hypothetical protein IJS74_01620 [Clostridia bacterium]|nr:hypothetical protein [Clostridia bacterium]